MGDSGRTVDVPVADGHLVVHLLNEAPPEAPAVVALHSLSSNGLSWQAVADALIGVVRVVAPDMRGRAESAGLRSRGLADHAADAAAVASELGLRRPLVAGHSMGAFAAALTGATYPDRFRAVVLVDGGLAFPAAPATDLDARLRTLLGPAMTRLRMDFADEAAYLEHWHTHDGLRPLLEGPTGDHLRAFLLHDLAGVPGRMRTTSSLESVRADWEDMLADAAALSAIHTLQCPAHLLWARRGPLDEPTGLYSDEGLAAARLPGDVASTALDTNHYGALLEPAGVSAVAGAVRELAAA